MNDVKGTIIIASVIIGAAIIFSSLGISHEVSSSDDYATDPYTYEISDSSDVAFLDNYDAATYLGISIETFDKLFESGELEGTYTKYESWQTVFGDNDEEKIVNEGVRYIFSKSKLTEYMNNRIDKETQ